MRLGHIKRLLMCERVHNGLTNPRTNRKERKMNTSMNLGKRFELLCMADIQHYIMENGILGQIYTPIVDDSGIDFAIRMANGKYIEIQAKARAEKRLFTIDAFTARPNYWFIFYCKNTKGDYDRYILSSKEVAKALTKNNHLTITKDMDKYSKRDFDYILHA